MSRVTDGRYTVRDVTLKLRTLLLFVLRMRVPPMVGLPSIPHAYARVCVRVCACVTSPFSCRHLSLSDGSLRLKYHGETRL